MLMNPMSIITFFLLQISIYTRARSRSRNTMADNAALTNTIALLVTAIIGMPIATPLTPRVFGPFALSDPFDLSFCSGSSAYATISAPLDDIWGGDVSTFPSFIIVDLCICAIEGKWDVEGTTDAATGAIIPNPKIS